MLIKALIIILVVIIRLQFLQGTQNVSDDNNLIIIVMELMVILLPFTKLTKFT